MSERLFGTSIKIVSMKSKKLYEDAKPLGDEEGKAFVDGVYHLLEELKKKQLGKSLLRAIEKSKKTVIIYCDDGHNGSAALPYPATMENELKRYIKLRQIPDNAFTKLQKEKPKAVKPAMATYAALFHHTLEAAKANRDVAAVVMGLTRADLDEVENGRMALPPEAYHRFAMFYYDFLDAGEGCDVGLRFDPDQPGPNDPEVICLGHELVHAWRMVTGMRIFEGGWEEENMTAGLPPFVNLKYTENKLRIEHGFALRTSYTARCTTGHYQIASQFGGQNNIGKGIWPEHLRAWEQWQQANPDKARDGLKITKKSTFSGPIRNIYNR
jgi:hypothetical protein